MIVRAINNHGVEGYFRTEDGRGDAACFSMADTSDLDFNLYMALGARMVIFDNPSEYLFREYAKTELLKELMDRVRQKQYNGKLRERDDRVKLLSELVANELERISSGDSTLLNDHASRSYIDLFTDIYGDRIWGHPEYSAYLARFRFFLDSLVEAGDLQRVEQNYLVSPSALNSLARDAVDDRRHQDIVKQNRLITFLTAILAVSALVQIFID